MRKPLIAFVCLVALSQTASSWTTEVCYEITGTVHMADLTKKNKDGSSEQTRVDVPFEQKFYAPAGTSLYLSVQKTKIVKEDGGIISPRYIVVDDGIHGTVHVLIRVGGKVLQEAEASTPYGIATASGVVPE